VPGGEEGGPRRYRDAVEESGGGLPPYTIEEIGVWEHHQSMIKALACFILFEVRHYSSFFFDNSTLELCLLHPVYNILSLPLFVHCYGWQKNSCIAMVPVIISSHVPSKTTVGTSRLFASICTSCCLKKSLMHCVLLQQFMSFHNPDFVFMLIT